MLCRHLPATLRGGWRRVLRTPAFPPPFSSSFPASPTHRWADRLGTGETGHCHRRTGRLTHLRFPHGLFWPMSQMSCPVATAPSCSAVSHSRGQLPLVFEFGGCSFFAPSPFSLDLSERGVGVSGRWGNGRSFCGESWQMQGRTRKTRAIPTRQQAMSGMC